MQIQWLGHSCFRISQDGYAIVIDPYADGYVPGLRPLRLHAQQVLCSHGHRDHNAKEAVRLEGAARPSPFAVTRIASAHDGQGGALRGENTIHVLDAGGVRVAHLGDLGAMLTAAQVEAIGPLDAVLIPVGGYYTIDAETAAAVCRVLGPPVIVPMHYRSDAFGFDVLATVEPFLALADRPVMRYDTDTVDVTKTTPPQVAVPAYLG